MSKDMTNKDEAPPLTAAEGKKLEQLKKIVFIDLRAFIRVGNALAEIRERKLYREVCLTFEGYCKLVFDLGERRAYQLMDAYEVTENLNNCSGFEDDEGEIIELKPINEAQCRPMAGLLPEQQRQIWGYVVECAGQGEKITASLVSKIVKKFKGEDLKSQVRNAQTFATTDILVSAPFQKAFDAFSKVIEVEVNAGFKGTGRSILINRLDQLRGALSESGAIVSDPVFKGNDDAEKLEKAGFTLFRMDYGNKTILTRSGGSWPVYEADGRTVPYTDDEDMQGAFAKLLKDPMHLRG